MSEYSDSDAKPTQEEILAEINRLRDELGTYPKRREFQEHSDFDMAAVTYHFEWWGDAISAARSKDKQAEPTQEEILAEINRLRDELGTYPKRQEFQEHSDFDIATVTYHFEWWGTAIGAARSKATTTSNSTSEQEASTESKSNQTEQTSEADNAGEGLTERGESDEKEGKPGEETTDGILDEIESELQDLSRE